MLLVLFNKQLVNGVCLEKRPEVYRLSKQHFLVGYKGKQLLVCDEIEESYMNIDVNGLEKLQYVGSVEDEEEHGATRHFYLSDKKFCKEKRGLVVDECDKKIDRIEYINYKEIQKVEIFADSSVCIKGNYCFIKSGDYYVIDIQTGKMIFIEDMNSITNWEYVQQAVVSNRVEFLKKLAEIYDNGIKYLGRYYLYQISPSKVSLEDLWQESQKAEAKEMLFMGYGRAVYNLVKALEYKDQVEGWGEEFSNYKVIVHNKREVKIFRDNVKVAEFTYMLEWRWMDDNPMVYDLCHKYSLCKVQLSKVGLKCWAAFLKSCKVEWVEVD